MTTPSTDTFLNRRTVLKLCGAASLGCLLDPWESLAAGHAKARRFHLCLSPDTPCAVNAVANPAKGRPWK